METHDQKEGSLPGTLCLQTSFLMTAARSEQTAMRRKHSAAVFEPSSPDALAVTQAHLAHIATLREARAHHRAITHELKAYFEAVATEVVPEHLLNSLNEPTDERSL
jgi:hypothetical protein